MDKHLNARQDSVIADLVQHAAETGKPLPMAPLTIDKIERFLGVAVDLDTGGCVLDMPVDDSVRTLDEGSWLASLEEACDGRVMVAWVMTPEAYFAQLTNDKVTE